MDGLPCSGCGQRATPPETLSTLAREWFERVFGGESILWSTLRRLILSPGSLTVDWWEGRRAAIMSPVRTVLVVLFLATVLATAEHLLAGVAEVDAGKLVAAFTYQLIAVGTLICLSVLRRLLPRSRQRTDYEIATFALYEGAFLGLLVGVVLLGLIFSNLLPPIFGLLNGVAPLVLPLLALVGLGHPTLHLKQAFGLSWLGAVARMLVLVPVMVFAMMIVSGVLAATGVAALWAPAMGETEFGTFHKVSPADGTR